MPKSVPTSIFERAWRRKGLRLVAGIDEVGRGAWAGPVVAAAVILPPDLRPIRGRLKDVTDSKQLTSLQRERLYEVIYALALSVGIGGAGPNEVDRTGLTAATRAAMQRAVAMLYPQPQALLIDAVDLRSVVALPQRFFAFGDALSLSIAAASIVAKVSRDRWMVGLSERLPGYGFAEHKGYGTRQHCHALARLGVTDVHRRSYAPILKLCLSEAARHRI